MHALITAFVFVGFTQSAQAAIISTEQVVTAAAAEQNRAKVAATFNRADVQAELQRMGINTEEAQARAAAMTDAETASIAHQVDSLPIKELLAYLPCHAQARQPSRAGVYEKSV